MSVKAMWNFSVVPRRISIRLNAEDKWALSTQFLKKTKQKQKPTVS